MTDDDGVTDDDGTVLGTEVFEVDSEDSSELEELVLEVKHLIISLLKERDLSFLMLSRSYPDS